MVAFKNSTGIKANSSFCTFRFPIAEAHQLTKPFQYQPITTTSPTQPFAHFVFMPIKALKKLQLKNDENQIILYQDDDEITRVSVRFADEDLWLTQNQLAEIYSTTKQNISQHIDNILNDGELDANRTVKDFLTVRQEGNRQVKRSIDHYNLDMIIALGYRVQSQVATRFRRWATQRLHEYIQKGFAMDDERLKQGVS